MKSKNNIFPSALLFCFKKCLEIWIRHEVLSLIKKKLRCFCLYLSRSTGLELSIQQRFRWVHLRNDIEPIKNMLPRQLYRKLLTRYSGQMPPADSATFRAVEWVICVWQRLNEGLGKLGLPELTLGPAIFLQCPIEVNKPKAIYK